MNKNYSSSIYINISLLKTIIIKLKINRIILYPYILNIIKYYGLIFKEKSGEGLLSGYDTKLEKR